MTETSQLPGAVVYGTPRQLPTVLLCHADRNFCGRHWIANNWKQFEEHTTSRKVHELLCGARPGAEGVIQLRDGSVFDNGVFSKR